MKKFTKEYKELVYESLYDTMKDNLSQNYNYLKEGVLTIVENSMNSTEELVDVQNFINDYIENPDTVNLIGFIENGDIFDFYLKYEMDINNLCEEKKYFDQKPNVNSLYQYVIDGTKFSFLECLKLIQKDYSQ
jgi:hypothetical protein